MGIAEALSPHAAGRLTRVLLHRVRMTGTRRPFPLRSREPQGLASFRPGDTQAGFYNDLRGVALGHGSPARALDALAGMTARRRLANPVSVAQLGLGAWQLRGVDGRWLDVVAATSGWLVSEMDDDGLVPYLFAVPHTYRLNPPWHSAMAQGEAASLLVRAAHVLDRPDLGAAAMRAVVSLVDERFGLVAATPEGPVLQEYPTAPPAHVLNGWISALWGLYDVAHASPAGEWAEDGGAAVRAARSFDQGAEALALRLHLYDAGLGWSRYDLFPHRIAHVASPFYHRLHVAQLHAMSKLRPDLPALSAKAARWDLGSRNRVGIAVALARKVMFRTLKPRRPPA